MRVSNKKIKRNIIFLEKNQNALKSKRTNYTFMINSQSIIALQIHDQILEIILCHRGPRYISSFIINSTSFNLGLYKFNPMRSWSETEYSLRQMPYNSALRLALDATILLLAPCFSPPLWSRPELIQEKAIFGRYEAVTSRPPSLAGITGNQRTAFAMDWATAFAEDLASFELTMQGSLPFVILTRACQTDQLLLAVILEIF